MRRSRHHNPRPERPSNLRTLRSIGPVNLKNLPLLNLHTEGVSNGKKQKWHRPPIGGQDRDGVSNRRSAPYTLCLFEAFPSRGNEGSEEKNSESYISCTIPAFSPFGGERSEPITRMRIMPYDTESQSRNADFISIARRAIHNPRPEGPSNLRTLRTFGTKSRQPSHRRCVPCSLFYA